MRIEDVKKVYPLTDDEGRHYRLIGGGAAAPRDYYLSGTPPLPAPVSVPATAARTDEDAVPSALKLHPASSVSTVGAGAIGVPMTIRKNYRALTHQSKRRLDELANLNEHFDKSKGFQGEVTKWIDKLKDELHNIERYDRRANTAAVASLREKEWQDLMSFFQASLVELKSKLADSDLSISKQVVFTQQLAKIKAALLGLDIETTYEEAKAKLFNEALARIAGEDLSEGEKEPTCFISYAWGHKPSEERVHQIGKDLRKAAVEPTIDIIDNREGSIAHFVQRTLITDYVLVIGSPELKEKWDMPKGHVLPEELDLIAYRKRKRADQHGVIRVLLTGNVETSFPDYMQTLTSIIDLESSVTFEEQFFTLLIFLYSPKPKSNLPKAALTESPRLKCIKNEIKKWGERLEELNYLREIETSTPTLVPTVVDLIAPAIGGAGVRVKVEDNVLSLNLAKSASAAARRGGLVSVTPERNEASSETPGEGYLTPRTKISQKGVILEALPQSPHKDSEASLPASPELKYSASTSRASPPSTSRSVSRHYSFFEPDTKHFYEPEMAECKGTEPVGNLPKPAKDFRRIKTAELSTIVSKLKDSGSDGSLLPTLSLVLCGPIGSGKTELALDYIQHGYFGELNESSRKRCVWFDAETYSSLKETTDVKHEKENIINDQWLKIQFHALAKKMNWSVGSIPSDGDIDVVKDHIAEDPGWLLVFDNARSYESIKDFIPENGAKILITSQYEEWGSLEKLYVKALSVKEVQFVNIDRTVLDSMPELLRDLKPVEIIQVCQIIKTYGIPLYREKKAIHAGKTSWEICLEVVKENFLFILPILQACSYLKASHIPEEIVTELCEVFAPSCDFFSIRQILTKYKLMKYNSHSKFFSIPENCQKIVREKMFASKEECLHVLKKLLIIMESLLNRSSTKVIAHQSQIFAQLDMLLLRITEHSFVPDTLILTRLYNKISEILIKFGDEMSLKKALFYLERALEISPNDMLKAKIYKHKGRIYRAYRDLEKASHCYAEAIGLVKAKPELEAVWIELNIYHALVDSLSTKDEYEENLSRTLGSYIEKAKVIFGQSIYMAHLYNKMAEACHNYSVKLQKNDNGHEKDILEGLARKYTECAFKLLDELKETDSSAMATAHNNYTILFPEAHDALSHLEEAMEIRRKFLGEDHSDYAINLCNFAIELVERKKNPDKAIDCFNKALKIYLKNKNSKHSYVGWVYYNLAKAFEEVNNVDAAIDAYWKSLERYLPRANEEFGLIPTIVDSYNKLTFCYFKKHLETSDKKNAETYAEALRKCLHGAEKWSLKLQDTHPMKEKYKDIALKVGIDIGGDGSAFSASPVSETLLTKAAVEFMEGSMPASVHQAKSKNLLEISGLTYQRIPGDGHCLFHAVGLYVGQDQASLRNLVAAHIEHNSSEFREIIESANPGRTLEEYLEAIRSGIEWADHFEIVVLMRILNRPIVVIEPSGRIRNRLDLAGFIGEPIFVYYNGIDHYDAYLLMDGWEHGRSKEIVASLIRSDERSHDEKAGKHTTASPKASATGFFAQSIAANIAGITVSTGVLLREATPASEIIAGLAGAVRPRSALSEEDERSADVPSAKRGRLD